MGGIGGKALRQKECANVNVWCCPAQRFALLELPHTPPPPGMGWDMFKGGYVQKTRGETTKVV